MYRSRQLLPGRQRPSSMERSRKWCVVKLAVRFLRKFGFLCFCWRSRHCWCEKFWSKKFVIKQFAFSYWYSLCTWSVKPLKLMKFVPYILKLNCFKTYCCSGWHVHHLHEHTHTHTHTHTAVVIFSFFDSNACSGAVNTHSRITVCWSAAENSPFTSSAVCTVSSCLRATAVLKTTELFIKMELCIYELL